MDKSISSEKVIIYTENNQVKVVHPIPISNNGDIKIEADDYYKKVAENAVPDGVPYRITNISKLPSDREFRDCWTDDNKGDTVGIDIHKAKVLQISRIRNERNKKWKDFDQRYLIAERDGLDLMDLKAERKTLQNIPNKSQTKLTAASTVEDIKAVFPRELS